MKNLPEPSVNMQQAVIAVNRFGLGAKPGELIQATSDPKNWLKTSLSPIVYSSSLPASGEIQQKLVEYREQEKKLEKELSKKKAPAMDEAMNMAPEMDDESSKMMKEMKKYPQEVYRNYIIDSA